MEFTFSEEQLAISELSQQILSEQVSDASLRELADSDDSYDKRLWAMLVEAGLVGMAVPETLEGSGMGLAEICLLLEEQGRNVAPVPLLATQVLGGLPIAEFGSEQQRQRYLQPMARGEMVLTGAFAELGMPSALRSAAVLQSNNVLNGSYQCVPYAQESGCILVPVSDDQGHTRVYLIEPDTAGVVLEYQDSTNHEPLYTLHLNDVAVSDEALLGDVDADAQQGSEIVEWILQRANVAVAAIQLGVAEEALRRTAEYTSERKQFGRAIASFQGTSLRCADAYIDIEAMRSTYWQALWRLTEGLPAAAEVGAAKWWSCRGTDRVVHTAQHLHGGIGSDLEYPLHRYFLWAKQMQLSFGGATQQLASLGALFENKNKVVNVL